MFSKLKGVFSKLKKEAKSEAKAKEKVSKEAKAGEAEKTNGEVKADTKITLKKRAKKFFPISKKKGQKVSKESKPEGTLKAEKKQKKLGGFFAKLSEKKQKALIDELEEGLIQNNVAYDAAQKICSGLKSGKKEIKSELEGIIKEILEKPGKIDLLEKAKGKKPFVILFVGVNGVGKTTTVAKLAKWLINKKKSVVLAAADTFRAAAIEQLQTHADKIGVKLIKHKYGSDSAAVAYDAIEHAKAKNLDFVLIDSAGRSHANTDLMDELAKVKRVAKPDLTILVVDSLTGNDATEQAKIFNEKVGIDCSILTKTDADERGGAIISVGYESGRPILFLGCGQEYKDLKEFDSKEIIRQIL